MELRYVKESDDDYLGKAFIPPNLPVVERGVEPDRSQILIISAPGAVGKSTLSKSLALEKGAILYDLAATAPVGSSSFSGALLNAFGGDLADQFSEYLSEGLQFVVIDALDEGRVKVTEDAFLSFLENIRRLAENAKGVCFVLLGRTQVAEDAWITLNTESNSSHLLAIESFDRKQADEYINKRIESEKRTPVFEEC